MRKLWPDAADEVATAALARVDQPQAGAAKDAGGRPRKHDKDQFLHEIIRISNQPDGLPERHLLTRQMAQWCEDTWGYQPGDSVLRDWIREVLDYLESARLKRR